MTTKIIIDLDSIDQTEINAVYSYINLKEKIRETEERLKSLNNDLNYLISSTNFRFIEEKEENKHPLPSFMGIDSLAGVTHWIKVNRDIGVETKDSEELRRIMKRMFDCYNSAGISHCIRCNFNVQEFLISEMNVIIDKIYGDITAYNRYDNSYDPFVAFFFSNIYGILAAVEKTSKTVGYTEKK